MSPSLSARVETFFRERLPRIAGFEERPGQVEMARAVAEAFETEGILLAEAGTGTGKSLAYLIPALLWRAGGGEGPVVVASRTLNLQQQILDVDVPRLQGPLGLVFRAVQARGWSNYLCLRRVQGLPRSGELTPHEDRLLAEVKAHLADGGGGLRSEVPLEEGLWARLACDSMACGRQRCPFFERCFFFRERRALEGADLILTNHALLLSDLALRRDGAPGILPGLERLVLDEAHHLEETATDHLGDRFLRSDFFRFLQQLYRPRALTEEGGFLAGLRLALTSAPLAPESRRQLMDRVDQGLLSPLPALGGAAEEMLGLLAERIPPEVEKIPVDEAWFESAPGEQVRRAGQCLLERLLEAAGSLREIAEGLGEAADWEAGQGLKLETQAFSQRLESIRQGLERCLTPDSLQRVHWAEASTRDAGLGAVPLDVGPQLSELLFAKVRTAILTSATLTVRGSMNFLQSRVGLEAHQERLKTLVVASPFDFSSQALLAVARGLPDPGSADFARSVAPGLLDLVRGLGGRTFLLVTSWRMLRDLEALLGSALAEAGIEVLCQGRADRSVLLNRFRTRKRAVLLGTDSFWEGVDVPGEALSCVVMARLPFRVPSDPVHQARSNRLSEAGANPFSKYHLPLAVVKFRQGFGRLIRTAADRGVVLVLDGRLLSRSYGRAFLGSLPECGRVEGPLEQVVEDCLEWLRGSEVEGLTGPNAKIREPLELGGNP